MPIRVRRRETAQASEGQPAGARRTDFGRRGSDVNSFVGGPEIVFHGRDAAILENVQWAMSKRGCGRFGPKTIDSWKETRRSSRKS